METPLRVVAPEPEAGSGRQSQRTRPLRPLPTDRMGHAQQPEVLRTVGRLSGPAQREVDSNDIATSMNLATSTAGLLNRFFVEAGWLTKAGKGKYKATEPLIEYVRHLSVDPDNELRAARFLAATFQESFYWEAIASQIAATGSMRRNDAVILLMKEAGASPAHRPQVENVLFWMAYVGLVDIEDDTIRLAHLAQGSYAHDTVVQPGNHDVDVAVTTTPDSRTAVSEPTTPHEFVVSFSVNVNLTADDLKGLSPEQINAVSQAIGTLAAIAARQ